MAHLLPFSALTATAHPTPHVHLSLMTPALSQLALVNDPPPDAVARFNAHVAAVQNAPSGLPSTAWFPLGPTPVLLAARVTALRGRARRGAGAAASARYAYRLALLFHPSHPLQQALLFHPTASILHSVRTGRQAVASDTGLSPSLRTLLASDPLASTTSQTHDRAPMTGTGYVKHRLLSGTAPAASVWTSPRTGVELTLSAFANPRVYHMPLQDSRAAGMTAAIQLSLLSVPTPTAPADPLTPSSADPTDLRTTSPSSSPVTSLLRQLLPDAAAALLPPEPAFPASPSSSAAPAASQPVLWLSAAPVLTLHRIASQFPELTTALAALFPDAPPASIAPATPLQYPNATMAAHLLMTPQTVPTTPQTVPTASSQTVPQTVLDAALPDMEHRILRAAFDLVPGGGVMPGTTRAFGLRSEILPYLVLIERALDLADALDPPGVVDPGSDTSSDTSAPPSLTRWRSDLIHLSDPGAMRDAAELLTGLDPTLPADVARATLHRLLDRVRRAQKQQETAPSPSAPASSTPSRPTPSTLTTAQELLATLLPVRTLTALLALVEPGLAACLHAQTLLRRYPDMIRAPDALRSHVRAFAAVPVGGHPDRYDALQATGRAMPAGLLRAMTLSQQRV